ncbi:MAG: hypothetical protein IKU58_07815 [Clostridia bacterium]|nr:hypothetical protein [Clostridia bacterium]
MANTDERYSLEDILAEFKQPEEAKTARQTAQPAPPAAKPAVKPVMPASEKALSEAEMERQEAALQARMEARRKEQEKKKAAEPDDDTILATISRIKKENDAIPVTQRQGSTGQITMKFPAVKEMARKAQEAPPKPEEAQPEPLDFAAFTKREVPPRKAPAKPTEEDKQRNRTSAPWRTAAEPGKHQTEKAEEKAPPRLRTIDLTTGRPRPEPEDFDPEEPEEKLRRPKRRLWYDRVNRPSEDAAQTANQLGRRLGGMAARLLLFLPVVVTSMYVTLAMTRGLPMPVGFTFEAYPQYYMGILALCQLLTLLLCMESTLSGLWRLFHGKPTMDTVLTLSGLASLAYCGVAAFLPEWRVGAPYVCVTAVTGFYALTAKRQRYEALRRGYKALTMGTSPSGVKLYTDGKIRDLAVKTQSGTDVPLEALSLPDFTETYSCVYSPIAIVLGLALALAATFAKGNTTHLLWSLSAIYAMTTPMCLLLSSSASAKRLSKKLYTSGSMLVNARSAGRLAKSRAAVLRDADLYPAGSVKITGMKIADNQEPDVVVGCAAALLQEVGGGLAKAFVEFARQMYIVPNKAKELRFFDTRGIAANVSGRYVQLGTASYLMRMGIRVTEGLKLKDSIFVAIDSQFAGIFSIHYQVMPQVYTSFGLLKGSRIRPVLALRDTNQTQSTVESRFELKRDATFQPDLEERLRYSASSFGKDEETLALLSRDGLMPFAEVLAAAAKWRRAAVVGCVLGTMCALVGMLILAFLTGEAAVTAADPLHVLAYLVIWSLPLKLIRGIVTRI